MNFQDEQELVKDSIRQLDRIRGALESLLNTFDKLYEDLVKLKKALDSTEKEV